jgi:glycosyltransferase involved in cell wall biosynthesis
VIDLVAMVPQGETVVESDATKALGVRSTTVIRRPRPGLTRHLRNVCRHPFRALTLAQYSTPKLGEQLRALAFDREALIVFDGLHAAAWLYELAQWTGRSFVYRAHNVEADLWFRAASRKNALAAPLLHWQGNAVRKFETKLCRASRQVLTVSDEDANRFRQLVPEANVATLPIGMSPKPQREALADGTRILFIGRLDWPPNRDGLAWFLEKVWPMVTRRFTLDIVGSGDGAWLEPYLNDPRIQFHGMVDDVTPYYHAAVANIVPIFFGSGTRVKAIESCLFATACIGTSLGVEGIGLDPGREYFRAESEAEWIETLNTLDPELARQRGQNALQRASERFDRDRTAERFLDLLRRL